MSLNGRSVHVVATVCLRGMKERQHWRAVLAPVVFLFGNEEQRDLLMQLDLFRGAKTA